MAVGALTALMSVVAQAGESANATAQHVEPPPKYYQQPKGFGAHQWGDALQSFSNLSIGEPVAVEASRDGPDNTATERFSPCFQQVLNQQAQPCDIVSYVARLGTPARHTNMHLIMQYRNAQQGFRINGDVLLHPVTHFFCTDWEGDGKRPPADMAQRMKYCGIRLAFTSETTDELSAQPREYVSRYERLLRHIVRTYGPPYGYKGRVIVSDAEQVLQGDPGLREFQPKYRWCTDLDSIMAPKCDVKMIMSFNATTGEGSLLMAAPSLQSFARAQAGEGHVPHGDLYYELLTTKEPPERTASATPTDP